MDVRFVDEARIAVGLSTGGVALLRFRPTHQVGNTRDRKCMWNFVRPNQIVSVLLVILSML